MLAVYGLILLVLAVALFLIALPRGGQPRAFLTSDTAQGVYSVAIVVIGAAGAALSVVGLVSSGG